MQKFLFVLTKYHLANCSVTPFILFHERLWWKMNIVLCIPCMRFFQLKKLKPLRKILVLTERYKPLRRGRDMIAASPLGRVDRQRLITSFNNTHHVKNRIKDKLLPSLCWPLAYLLEHIGTGNSSYKW